jgi:hypothetical protein
VGNYTETDIGTKLAEDYRRRIKESGISADGGSDPAIEILMQTVAHRINSVEEYVHDHLPTEILDQLIANLGIPVLRSRPAQTVVRFHVPKDTEYFDRFTKLIAYTATRDRLIFHTDSALRVSEAKLAFAAGYEDGRLLPLACDPYPAEIEGQYSRDPVSVDLGPAPFLLFAFDLHPDVHLDRHGIFLDLTLEGKRLLRPAQREIWCLLDEQGTAQRQWMMTPEISSGGLQRLRWIHPSESSLPPSLDSKGEVHELAEGFFGSLAYQFPALPQDRRPLSLMPVRLAEPMRRMFRSGLDSAFRKPRGWIKVLLPPDLRNFTQHVRHVWVNTVTASNVEVFEETIRFESGGTSIPVSNEAGMGKHLVRPISIQGNRGRLYVPAEAPIDDSTAGRYALVHGRLKLTPGRSPDGQTDEYVNVRLLVSDGMQGNNVIPGGLQSFATHSARPGIRIENPVQSAGGTDSVPYAEKYDYFADMIRSRERLVTRADIDHFIRSMDRRINDEVQVQPALERQRGGGLKRIYRMTIRLRRKDFAEPDVEEDLLIRKIENELERRAPLDLQFKVEVLWN